MARRRAKQLTHPERAARRAALAADVARGEDVGEVARRHGVSLATVRTSCLAAHVVPGALPSTKVRAATSFQILAALLRGERMVDIADHFGVSKQRVEQIQRAAREAGIEVGRLVLKTA
jgi:transposase